MAPVHSSWGDEDLAIMELRECEKELERLRAVAEAARELDRYNDEPLQRWERKLRDALAALEEKS